MAGSVNKVILVGNLGKDPDIRRTQNNDAIVNLSVATSESWRDKQTGERRDVLDRLDDLTIAGAFTPGVPGFSVAQPVIAADLDPDAKPRLIARRETSVQYDVEHHPDWKGEETLVIRTNAEKAEDFLPTLRRKVLPARLVRRGGRQARGGAGATGSDMVRILRVGERPGKSGPRRARPKGRRRPRLL